MRIITSAPTKHPTKAPTTAPTKATIVEAEVGISGISEDKIKNDPEVRKSIEQGMSKTLSVDDPSKVQITAVKFPTDGSEASVKFEITTADPSQASTTCNCVAFLAVVLPFLPVVRSVFCCHCMLCMSHVN